jgi:TonB family protein
MKSLWAIISTARLYMFIFSVSIHMLILSIPVSVVIKPQIHDMELFVSVEDLWVSPESVKTQMERKKPRPVPVKGNIKLIEVPRLQIKKPETIESVRKVRAESVKEVKKDPTEEVKVEPVGLELNTQPTTECKETLSIPTFRGGTGENTDVPTGGTYIGMPIGVGERSSGSQNTSRSDAGTLIETRFGATIAPAFLHREMPVYPMFARKLGKEGKVVLRLTIDEKGNLLNVEVLEKAGYGFTEAAVEAVKKSTFLPAKKDGKRIASRALLPIRFQLERN